MDLVCLDTISIGWDMVLNWFLHVNIPFFFLFSHENGDAIKNYFIGLINYINTKKSVVIAYTNNKQSKNDIKKIIQFI